MTNHRNIIYENYHSKFNSRIANVTQNDLDSLYRHYDEKILPSLKLFRKNSSILELGCGPGYLLDYLKQKGYVNVKGIDISEEQIEIAQSKGHNVSVGDVFVYLKNSTEKFDVIFAFDLLEHFTKDELLELTELVHYSLREEGLFLIRTPNGQGIFAGQIIYGDLTHQTILNPNSLTQLLAINGFKEIKFIENSPVGKNLFGILRLFLWKSLKLFLNFMKIIESGGKQDIWTHDFFCIAKK
ncbi:SAM-dependent methyltransferase [Ignavibacterium album JCM 16511]|uniref:SAM-dependent methyltransferase n=1 Tax=Ignavibacterium album (strain DSM 19864 / JCM 16511 / NBRC 101810 / Mat9-16) TaxID=945713 RepID=I0ALD2_IGNAJ|nr:class I SAM-dependent methyltransferase [Ignavibacterium album]AFH49789.1 SAM-dependent methyltransferase [Ignavibacterium album JCM 16511]